MGPATKPVRGGPRWARARLEERGQSIVEFALVLPFLLIILFSIFEFGFILSDEIQLANAARDAARVASLNLTNGTLAVNQAQSDLVSGLIQCPSLTVTPAGNIYTTGAPYATATVRVQCSYNPVTPLGALASTFFGSSPLTSGSCSGLNLCSTSVMKVEQ